MGRDGCPEELREVEGIVWTPEHKKAYRLFCQGRSFFLSGPAGVGKSTLINEIKQYFKPEQIAITGSTGMAAILLGGVTLHMFAGVFSTSATPETLVRKMTSAKKKEVAEVEVLVMDEVSMLNADTLDTVDAILQEVRNNRRPFGAIQVIMAGDFRQLPPVVKAYGPGAAQKIADSMPFNSKVWRRARIQTVELTHVFRQADEEFAFMLSRVRIGSMTRSVINAIRECTASWEDRGIEPPEFVPHISARNESADQRNREQFDMIDGAPQMYRASFKGTDSARRTLRNGRAHETLYLKKDMRVMLIANVDVKSSLVNGAIGTVVTMANNVVMVRFPNTTAMITPYTWKLEMAGRTVGEMTQIPLVPAYAFSIHKIQGSTLDFLVAYLDGVWDPGQLYVALSRVRDIRHLLIVITDIESLYRLPRNNCIDDFYRKVEMERIK